MALISYSDDDAAIDRLITALQALVDAHIGANGSGRAYIPEAPDPPAPDPPALRMQTVMLPWSRAGPTPRWPSSASRAPTDRRAPRPWSRRRASIRRPRSA